MSAAFDNTIERVTHYTMLGLIFLFPLFFLPSTTNFFEPNKLLLLVVATVVVVGSWALSVVARKEAKLVVSPFTIPLVLIALASVAATAFGANNYTESLMGRGMLIPALVLLTVAATNVIRARAFIKQALYALIASATVASFIGVFQSLGFGLSTLLNSMLGTSIPDTLAFSPAGSPLALIIFLAPVLLVSLFMAFTRKDSLERIVLFVISAVLTSGLVLSAIYAFPGRDTAPVFLPLRYGYAITLETLKDTGKALFGYGPEHFINAYNQHRPAAMNATRFWNIRFTSSSNEVFQIVTTMGVAGLLAWALMGGAIIKAARTTGKGMISRVIKVFTLGLLLLMFLVPATYIHYFLLFVGILLWSVSLKVNHDASSREVGANLKSLVIVRPGETSGDTRTTVPVLPYAISSVMLVLAGWMVYFTGSVYAAELTFKRALDAAAENDGLSTYNLQNQAIRQNPRVSRYRRGYSATNLALANSLAAKEDVTDTDRNNITQLIQQSIREAKAAVALDPENIANWENLTTVYRSLINVAQNADQWTVAALVQAIQNEPANPRLRLELGGVYYSLGDYDQAIRFYQQAAELKPDWANAYYNLSNAHKQKDELVQAFNYLRRVLPLLEADSADYTKATEELTALTEQLNLTAQEQQEVANELVPAQGELATPPAAPTVEPEAQVILPEDSGPVNLNETPAEPAGPSSAPVQPTEAPAPTEGATEVNPADVTGL